MPKFNFLPLPLLPTAPAEGEVRHIGQMRAEEIDDLFGGNR